MPTGGSRFAPGSAIPAQTGRAASPARRNVADPAHAMTELGLSARVHDKVLRLGRTIADLADADQITAEHVADAIHYRWLDRQL
ncbi:MAG: magnesium chelatase subunit ChlI family protein [Planctomycetota bacterium]